MKNSPMLEGTQNIIYAKVTNYGTQHGRIFDIDEEGANITFKVPFTLAWCASNGLSMENCILGFAATWNT